MKVNLLEGFSKWLEEIDESSPESDQGKGQDFDAWLRDNMNFRLKNFAELGDLQLTNTQFKTMDGDTIPVTGMVRFHVRALDDEGKVYELEDAGESDPNDPKSPEEPYGRSSPHAGKKYKLTDKEYQRLCLFPKQSQPGLGGSPMPGGGLPK